MMSANNDDYQIDYNVPEELERRLRYYQLRTRDVEKFKDDVTIELSQKARLIGDDLDVGKRSQGTGTISSSGTSITGSNTVFNTELRVADEITVTIITYPENHTVENQTRIVTAINSDTALTINTAFDPPVSEQEFEFFNVALITKDSSRVGIGTTIPEAKLAINGGVHVGGNSDPGDDNLVVDGSLEVGNDALVNGGMHVKGEVNLDDDLTVLGNTQLEQNLTVRGKITFGEQNRIITGDTTIVGNAVISGGIDVSANAEIGGSAGIGGNITVGGTFQFNTNSNNEIVIDEFSTDTELSGDSDSAVPTERAVKAYVDATFLNNNITKELAVLLPIVEKIKELGVLLPIVEIQGPETLAVSTSGDYSIEAPGAISYQWTASGAITITSENNTQSVTVTASNAPSTGTLSVEVGGRWNSSLTRTLDITVESSSSYSHEETFPYTDEIKTWTVPDGVKSIQIEAWGAQGGSLPKSSGSGEYTGGCGAWMRGDFEVSSGDSLEILLGQQGTSQENGAGGGGGSFVAKRGTTSTNYNCGASDEPTFDTPLLVAGGGGGATSYPGSESEGGNGKVDEIGGDSDVITNCGSWINPSPSTFGPPAKGGSGGNGGGPGCAGGGGGFFCAGANGRDLGSQGGASFVAGGMGGTTSNNPADPRGGFGGGGAGSLQSGGGGGGYSGGGGGALDDKDDNDKYGNGGGGGSYNAGTNQDNQPGVQEGDGQVIIRW